jgi:hypothetical protein
MEFLMAITWQVNIIPSLGDDSSVSHYAIVPVMFLDFQVVIYQMSLEE